MERMSLRAACDQARQWLESNDLDRAIGICEHILQQHPHNLETQRILGEAYLANRQLDRAQETFEQVLRSDPENIPAHVGLGIAFERRGKLERAVQEFEQALEIKPDMPELRSQLLRLYTDGGIENAQLRLSRAGLARLYAKGQMLPQAIAEFRHVIKEQPERADVKVALAETLWRDEQETESVALSRKLVDERPELLKAQLLLGYIGLGSGNSQGETNWRAAAAIDPEMAVANAMFDPLPMFRIDAPSVDAWDEQAWRRLREEQEQIAATRPMQSIPAVAEPEERPEADFVPGAAFFSSRTASNSFDPNESDDFLAGLLDLGAKSETPSAPTPGLSTATQAEMMPTTPPPSTEELGLDADMMPFSLADLGLSDDEVADLNGLDVVKPQTGAVTQPIAIDQLIQPTATSPIPDLELGDLPAFDLDQLDALAQPSEPTVALPDSAPAIPFGVAPIHPDAELADIAAFSFDALDDIPELSTPAAAGQPVQPVPDPDLDDLAAFSFGSLDDIPAFSAPSKPSASAAPVAPVIPDDDELGLADMQPFSLADLGLSDDEIVGLEGTKPNQQPTIPTPTASSIGSMDDLPADLQPFSMDELDRATTNSSEGLPSALQPFSMDDTPSTPGQRISGIQPDFGAEVGEEDDNDLPATGFSWQEPTQRVEPGFVDSIRPSDPTEDGSLFNKLKQFRQNIPETPAVELPDVSLAENEHLGLFSVDDVPLRDELASASAALMPQIDGIARREGTATTPIPPTTAATPAASPAASQNALQPGDDLTELMASGTVKPFSFADLGLSEDEVVELGIVEEPSAPANELVDSTVTINPGELQPFSLADLGLSSAEIAALGITEQPEIEMPAAAIEPEPIEVLPAIDPVVTELAAVPEQVAHIEIDTDLDLQSAMAAGEVQPFSFADLGLSDEEIAALGLGDMEPAAAMAAEATSVETPLVAEPIAPAAEVHEHIEIDTDLDLQSAMAAGEVKPFSFADLGLSDEEIAALGLAETAPIETEPTPNRAVQVEPIAPIAAVEPLTIAQPIMDANDPLGLGLNFDFGETQDSPAAAAIPTEAFGDDELQPFSLADFGFMGEGSSDADANVAGVDLNDPDRLGLTVAELNEMDTGGDVNLQAAPIAATPVVETSDINTGDPAADRLIALGRQQGFVDISDIIAAVDNPEVEADRIEAIGQLLHEQAIEIRDGDEVVDMEAEYTEEDAEPEFGTGSYAAIEQLPTTAVDEPDMTPFSLSELGLSDDEIEALGADEPVQPPSVAPTARSDAPDLEPLSLDDLDSLLEPVDTGTPVAPATADEPDLIPFSLSELGLPEEEIGALDPGVTPQAAEPVAAPVPASPVAPASSVQATTGNAWLDEYLQRVEREPDNYPLRLSVARAGARMDNLDVALRQYKVLARKSDLIQDVVDDLIDLIDDQDDPTILRQLHRALGDALSKQGLMDRAMEVYAWTPGLPKATH